MKPKIPTMTAMLWNDINGCIITTTFDAKNNTCHHGTCYDCKYYNHYECSRLHITTALDFYCKFWEK